MRLGSPITHQRELHSGVPSSQVPSVRITRKVNPEEGHKDDERAGTPVLRRQAETARVV